MIEKLAVPRPLLYDGSEQDMPPQFVLDINSQSLTVTKGEVSNKSFRGLKGSVSDKDFETIASGFKFEKFGDIALYTIDGVLPKGRARGAGAKSL
jgi:hypothetical protein